MKIAESEFGFTVELDPDGLSASLVVVPNDTPDLLLTPASVMLSLRQKKVSYGINEAAIQSACSEDHEFELNQHFLIAESSPPVHGKDGDVEFHVDVSGVATYTVDKKDKHDTQKIDYKNATRILCAKPGDHIATHFPPVEGHPGITVYGSPIPPRKLRDFTIRAGQNMEYRQSTNTYHALASGRPVFVAGSISVLPLYEVAGNVDYSTGHIKFAGSVIVHGDVLDDFNITAKDIVINGTVGSSELSADSNIMIHGGVNGKDKASLKAGGEICAKYINNATLDCLGDILVRRETVNSNILCNGTVRSGSLIGGNTVARMGVEVNTLGCDLGVVTRVEPGTDIAVRKIEIALMQISEKIEGVVKPAEMYFGNRAKFKTLPEEKRNELIKGYETFTRLHAAHIKLNENRQELINAATEVPLKEVIVLRLLHPDTIIKTDLCMKNFNKEAIGPMVVKEDVDRSTMSIEPYSNRTRRRDKE